MKNDANSADDNEFEAAVSEAYEQSLIILRHVNGRIPELPRGN